MFVIFYEVYRASGLGLKPLFCGLAALGVLLHCAAQIVWCYIPSDSSQGSAIADDDTHEGGEANERIGPGDKSNGHSVSLNSHDNKGGSLYDKYDYDGAVNSGGSRGKNLA